jgi:hypothetical protein
MKGEIIDDISDKHKTRVKTKSTLSLEGYVIKEIIFH